MIQTTTPEAARVIQDVTRQWERENRGRWPKTTDPNIVNVNGPSQYAENEPFIDAPPDAEAELDARIKAALVAAGLPLPYWLG